jgi:hypothetical protein
MRLLEPVRQYPVALLAVVALAFVSWVWWDALPNRPEPVPHADLSLQPVAVMTALTDTDAPPPLVRVLPLLKPGMSRAEVERLVGAPTGDIHPASVTGDRVTYHTAYEADFGAPPTVRPIRPMPKLPADPNVPRAIVTLEFDATRPGHPLVNVHYPDPLF